MVELTIGSTYKVDMCGTLLTLIYQGTVYDPVSERLKLKFTANGVISFVQTDRISKVEG
jgi:hypothetical protein